MKTIRITGIGKGEMEANLIELSLIIETTNKSYENSLNYHDLKLNKLMNLITTCGFDKDQLKTTRFAVYPNYNRVNTLKGYKEELSGYSVTQNLVLEFDLNMILLDKILTAISSSNINPRFNIRFTIKEKEKFENLLLEKAYNDAKNKAEILAKCSNQKIVGLHFIDFSHDTINVYSRTKYECNSSLYKESSIGENITPSNITDTSEATFVFEVE